MKNKYSIRPVRISSDAQFLYDLLLERNPKSNISHRKMPTFSCHLKFLQSKPYKKWYIICILDNTNVNKKIGSIYLSKTNEIGIFLLKKFQGHNIGKFALDEIIKKTKQKKYLANVSPKNKKSMRFFKNNGFKLIQYTFEKR